MQISNIIDSVTTDRGRTLKQASTGNPVLLVFLRHFGCVFCREAMKDIGRRKEEWQARNITVILVHMSEGDVANQYFDRFGVSGIEHISDPTCQLYASFGLGKGSASQLFGLKNWIRGFEATVINQTPIGLRQIGDGFQMPGVFLISEGEIRDSYIHASAADRPNYDALIECCAA